MKLKYVEIETKRIFNWLDPFNVTAKWACKAIEGDWWSEENVTIRRFFADTWTEEYDRITGHFTDIEESIKEKGILTPLAVDSGGPRGTYLKPFHFPPEMQGNLKEALHTVNFGGSRLTVAQKLDIPTVPCAVHDYANLFPDAPTITKDNYNEWFGDQYFFVNAAPQLRIKTMCHIKNQKYNGMNHSTRQAQQKAAEVAQEKTYKKFGLKK